MPYDTAENRNALETLLAEMFPDVVLSRAGVALLADRISDMNKWSATIHQRIDPKRPDRKRQASKAKTRILLTRTIRFRDSRITPD